MSVSLKDNLENNIADNLQQKGIESLGVLHSNTIEIALKEIKDCQAQNKTESCIFCKNMVDCAKRIEFEQKTQENLTQKQNELQSCQKSKGFSSCLNCAELLECGVRNTYVGAVYLSMNKGNGGSFEF